MFKKACDQFDRLKKRNAFTDLYRREKMFSDGLEEFDDSRNVVQDIIEEYEAAEGMDYPTRSMVN